jgi:hypothetical protein
MRIGIAVLFAMTFALGAAQAQEQEPQAAPASPPIETGTLIPGMNDAALARSARASKVIGSTVYSGTPQLAKSRTSWLIWTTPHSRQ